MFNIQETTGHSIAQKKLKLILKLKQTTTAQTDTGRKKHLTKTETKDKNHLTKTTEAKTET